ncbi:galactokinase [Flavitalea sp. BT771]|uniref:galactokinase n=1 Tax=Flavitalea sp. BT771 TaxID=3063329 RepID=UPI0026E1C7EE|nr:galactokinase [Flavitalea sp. BT771]MDO6431774.1 galactokinase [Flavitalea sp. BT771]MDV6220682.1 galactokinase [Flavitalea sp. BT771]
MIATQQEKSLSFRIIEKFKETFNTDPMVIRSPGRVNLIGEHTDYNNGFVMPAAINKAIYMAVSRRDDDLIHIVSQDLELSYLGDIAKVEPTSLHWPDYILGVVQQVQALGHPVGGFNCVFGGDIPLGAGMSSSAALECATAFSLNELFGLKMDPLTMVKLSQKAENEFVGVKCGIMDQFASMFGRRNHVIRLDCQSLEYEYVPFNTDGIRIVLLDTNVKHSLASSEYNTRRQQCEAGVALIRAHHPEVRSLRDATLEMLDKHVAPADALVYQRCQYVVEENLRLLAAGEDLKKGDIEAFGQKMFATHEGLSRKYAVSCPELDFLVEQVKGRPGVIGARMMGGGFGGCTINLVREAVIDELVAELTPAYARAMNKELKVYIGQIENGTSLI